MNILYKLLNYKICIIYFLKKKYYILEHLYKIIQMVFKLVQNYKTQDIPKIIFYYILHKLIY